MAIATIHPMKTVRHHLMAQLSSVASLGLILATCIVSTLAGGADQRAPEVPNGIEVSSDHKVHFHGYAIGFQIYTWNGTNWGAAIPDATLFDSEGNEVASHFAGPTWESNSGSFVVGAVVPPRITVDTNSIPWLRLRAVTTAGPGIFANTTFVQRVNTVGGNPPAVSGTTIGQQVKVPYTAEYFFYRAVKN